MPVQTKAQCDAAIGTIATAVDGQADDGARYSNMQGISDYVPGSPFTMNAGAQYEITEKNYPKGCVIAARPTYASTATTVALGGFALHWNLPEGDVNERNSPFSQDDENPTHASLVSGGPHLGWTGPKYRDCGDYGSHPNDPDTNPKWKAEFDDPGGDQYYYSYAGAFYDGRYSYQDHRMNHKIFECDGDVWTVCIADPEAPYMFARDAGYPVQSVDFGNSHPCPTNYEPITDRAECLAATGAQVPGLIPEVGKTAWERQDELWDLNWDHVLAQGPDGFDMSDVKVPNGCVISADWEGAGDQLGYWLHFNSNAGDCTPASSGIDKP